MRNPVTNMKIARTRAGLSQDAVAEILGVARTTVLRWESGESRITTEQVERLGEVYGVSPAFLVGWRPTSEEFAELEAKGAA